MLKMRERRRTMKRMAISRGSYVSPTCIEDSDQFKNKHQGKSITFNNKYQFQGLEETGTYY
jgi:hypothetical protein